MITEKDKLASYLGLPMITEKNTGWIYGMITGMTTTKEGRFSDADHRLFPNLRPPGRAVRMRLLLADVHDGVKGSRAYDREDEG